MRRYTLILLGMALIALTVGCTQDTPIRPDTQSQDTRIDLIDLFSADKGLVIESATLNLFVKLANYEQTNIHRITEAWDEETVTFNSFGGAYDPEVRASFTTTKYGWHEADVTALVQDWLHGTHPNHGLMLVCDDPLAGKSRIGAREGSTNQPYIEVVYNSADGQQTAILPDLADSYIWGYQPDTVHGSITNIYIGLGDDGESDLQKEAMLLFDTTNLPTTALLGDYVWLDEDRDGIQGAGELGIAGVTVSLYDCDGTLISSVVTDDAGYYRFDDVMPGDYYIEIEEPADHFLVDMAKGGDIALDSDIDPSTGRSACFAVNFDDKLLDIDAGLYAETLVDCGECDGHVDELTIRYIGDGLDELKVFDSRRRLPGRLMFEGAVASGDEFTVNGTKRRGQMHGEISFWNDGTRLARIHTSCSMPVGPGLIAGDFEIVSGSSRRGGPLCAVDVEPVECRDCQGRVSQLTLRYTGAEAQLIRAYDGNRQRQNRLMFEGTLYVGDEFTIEGTHRNGKMHKQISLWTEDDAAVKIVTDCSEAIGPGRSYGDFEIVEGYSRLGGLLCPAENPPAEEEWCEGGDRPSALTLVYTGQDCSHSSHGQDPCKVQCDGDPHMAERVYIVVTDRENRCSRRTKTWFEGFVNLGDSFEIEAAAGGRSELGSRTYVFVYSQHGCLKQFVEFHTSCSQPLGMNDQFGSIRVVGFED